VTSQRLSFEAPENALSRALRERRARGLLVHDLTESNPTRAGLVHDASLLQALASPASLLYEPDPKGLRAAREAVARYYLEKGARVDPERVLLTASTSEAYSLLFKLLCDPGDEVLVPEPSYPLFGWLTALEGVRAAPYPLRWDGEWHLDAGSLQAALDAAPRARAALVVSPGNPTGAFLKQDELRALSAICSARGLALISDEVFADFAAGPDARRVQTVADHQGALSFALSGLSKIAGLPQLKLGWCAVGGPLAEAERAVAQLELIADTYLSVGAPVQHAAAVLLEARRPFQGALRQRLERNRAALQAARPPGARWDLLPSEGGWSAILKVPRERSEEEWTLAALERGVLVQPGFFFDFPEGSHLVVSLLPPENVLASAAPSLAAALSGAE
jgi:aspartate/methionine/tyrosine aminotransferase